MAATEKIRVVVVDGRTLSLNSGSGIEATSTLYEPGGELELPADEAKQLVDDGFVFVKQA